MFASGLREMVLVFFLRCLSSFISRNIGAAASTIRAGTPVLALPTGVRRRLQLPIPPSSIKLHRLSASASLTTLMSTQQFATFKEGSDPTARLPHRPEISRSLSAHLETRLTSTLQNGLRAGSQQAEAADAVAKRIIDILVCNKELFSVDNKQLLSTGTALVNAIHAARVDGRKRLLVGGKCKSIPSPSSNSVSADGTHDLAATEPARSPSASDEFEQRRIIAGRPFKDHILPFLLLSEDDHRSTEDLLTSLSKETVVSILDSYQQYLAINKAVFAGITSHHKNLQQAAVVNNAADAGNHEKLEFFDISTPEGEGGIATGSATTTTLKVIDESGAVALARRSWQENAVANNVTALAKYAEAAEMMGTKGWVIEGNEWMKTYCLNFYRRNGARKQYVRSLLKERKRLALLKGTLGMSQHCGAAKSEQSTENPRTVNNSTRSGIASTVSAFENGTVDTRQPKFLFPPALLDADEEALDLFLSALPKDLMLSAGIARARAQQRRQQREPLRENDDTSNEVDEASHRSKRPRLGEDEAQIGMEGGVVGEILGVAREAEGEQIVAVNRSETSRMAVDDNVVPAKIKLLDVGSCYNPFGQTQELRVAGSNETSSVSISPLDVTAIDLYPRHPSVLQCDFLKLGIGAPDSEPVVFKPVESEGENGNEIENETEKEKESVVRRFRELKQLPAESFDALTLSLVLSYLPSATEREEMIRRARALLNSPPHSHSPIPSSSFASSSTSEEEKEYDKVGAAKLKELTDPRELPHYRRLLLIVEKESIFPRNSYHMRAVKGPKPSANATEEKGKGALHGEKGLEFGAMENDQLLTNGNNETLLVNWKRFIESCGFELLHYQHMKMARPDGGGKPDDALNGSTISAECSEEKQQQQQQQQQQEQGEWNAEERNDGRKQSKQKRRGGGAAAMGWKKKSGRACHVFAFATTELPRSPYTAAAASAYASDSVGSASFPQPSESAVSADEDLRGGDLAGGNIGQHVTYRMHIKQDFEGGGATTNSSFPAAPVTIRDTDSAKPTRDDVQPSQELGQQGQSQGQGETGQRAPPLNESKRVCQIGPDPNAGKSADFSRIGSRNAQKRSTEEMRTAGLDCFGGCESPAEQQQQVLCRQRYLYRGLTARPVGIVGGGLGGSALALSLQRKGVPFILFEKDASFDARKQGYALTMQQGGRALRSLGLENALREEGVVSTGGHHSFMWDGTPLGTYGGVDSMKTTTITNVAEIGSVTDAPGGEEMRAQTELVSRICSSSRSSSRSRDAAAFDETSEEGIQVAKEEEDSETGGPTNEIPRFAAEGAAPCSEKINNSNITSSNTIENSTGRRKKKKAGRYNVHISRQKLRHMLNSQIDPRHVQWNKKLINFDELAFQDTSFSATKDTLFLAGAASRVREDRARDSSESQCIHTSDQFVRLYFEDGSSVDVSMLVGADGIHSTVRAHVDGYCNVEGSGDTVTVSTTATSDVDAGVDATTSNEELPRGDSSALIDDGDAGTSCVHRNQGSASAKHAEMEDENTFTGDLFGDECPVAVQSAIRTRGHNIMGRKDAESGLQYLGLMVVLGISNVSMDDIAPILVNKSSTSLTGPTGAWVETKAGEEFLVHTPSSPMVLNSQQEADAKKEPPESNDSSAAGVADGTEPPLLMHTQRQWLDGEKGIRLFAMPFDKSPSEVPVPPSSPSSYIVSSSSLLAPVAPSVPTTSTAATAPTVATAVTAVAAATAAEGKGCGRHGRTMWQLSFPVQREADATDLTLRNVAWQKQQQLQQQQSQQQQQQPSPSPYSVLQQEALAQCAGWDPIVRALILNTPPEFVSGHPVYDRDPPDSPWRLKLNISTAVHPPPPLSAAASSSAFPTALLSSPASPAVTTAAFSGRLPTNTTRIRAHLVALLGDAAHPMSPFKGQGANQALLDASALSRALSYTYSQSHCQAVQRGELERKVKPMNSEREKNSIGRDNKTKIRKQGVNSTDCADYAGIGKSSQQMEGKEAVEEEGGGKGEEKQAFVREGREDSEANAVAMPLNLTALLDALTDYERDMLTRSRDKVLKSREAAQLLHSSAAMVRANVTRSQAAAAAAN